MTDAIVIEGLTKDYDGFKAVDSLSLRVKRDSLVGFLGPNGAGKSTTIKILTNLIKATSGSAYLDGVDVTDDPKAALSNVGAVVETPEFYPYLTPNETLEYIGRLRGMSKGDIDSRSRDVLELMRMSDVADKRIGKFSKGMRQRVAIGQSLMSEPSIIILDEPTSGLDPRGMVEVREILKDLRNEDLTVFMSSHLLNEVEDVCDTVSMMSQGKLIHHSTVDELRSMGGVRRLTVRTMRDMDAEDLEHIEGVVSVEVGSPTSMTVNFDGDDGMMNGLLRSVDATSRVTSFCETSNPIEAFYLSMIKESR